MFRVLSTPVNYKEKELDLIINLPHLVPQVTVDWLLITSQAKDNNDGFQTSLYFHCFMVVFKLCSVRPRWRIPYSKKKEKTAAKKTRPKQSLIPQEKRNGWFYSLPDLGMYAKYFYSSQAVSFGYNLEKLKECVIPSCP